MCEYTEQYAPGQHPSTRELVLADVKQLEFAATMELLKDKEIWIADTGASNHSTFNDDGCVNKKTSNISSQGAYGAGRTPECEMDIPTMVCDKSVNEKTGILMTGVSHMKNGNFNLFSVTRAVMSGWKLTGDKKVIEIKKGDLVISFDIVIKTTKGTLYCAHNDHGVTIMMIGYANYHEGNVYRMFNPYTVRVSETRDVIWLQ